MSGATEKMKQVVACPQTLQLRGASMCQGGTETPLYGPSPEGSPGRPRSAPEPADTARTVTRGSGPRGLCYGPNEVRPRERPASGPRLRPSPPTLPLRSGFARCPLSILAARRGPRLTARQSRAHSGRTVRGGWGATPRLEGTDRPPVPSRPARRPPLTRVRRAPASASRTLPGTPDT